MKFSRPRANADLINLTPLIDVVFQLLVFFMLAGSMKPTEAFPVDLAKSQSTQFGDAREGVVLVRGDGVIGFNESAMSKPQLLQAVADLLRRQPDALIQIKADADADANLVINVMESLREAGVGYIVLLTKGAGMETAP